MYEPNSVELKVNGATPGLTAGWEAKSFSDKYSVSNMSYPADLHNETYAGNMVVFYINIANASKFAPKDGSDAIYNMTSMDLPRIRLTTEGIPNTALGLAAANAAGTAIKTGAIGAVAGATKGFSEYAEKGLSNFFGQMATKTALGVGAGMFAEAPSAIGLGVAGSITGTTKREQKRLKAAIALHMPNNLNIRYTTNWGDTDTASIAMAGAGGEALTKALGDWNNATDVAKSIVANLGLSSDKGAAISAFTGAAANPRKELVFKGVDFRTFSFDYKFFPRNDAEAKNVENIINTFKFHMHPEFKDENSFIYLYPSEFDISYYSGNSENLHIHRHTSCVLTDMSINYTPNGNFSVFANGMPTQIDITLTFKELATMSKELISKGL